jgi:hypothetical protein
MAQKVERAVKIKNDLVGAATAIDGRSITKAIIGRSQTRAPAIAPGVT